MLVDENRDYGMLSSKLLDSTPASIHLHVADVAAVVDCARLPTFFGPEATRDPAWYDECFNTRKGPIVGYAYGLQHMTGTKTDGEAVDLCFRATACFRREDGHWRITTCTTPCPSQWTAMERRCSA